MDAQTEYEAMDCDLPLAEIDPKYVQVQKLSPLKFYKNRDCFFFCDNTLRLGAEEAKKKGNEYYKNGEYERAIEFYTQAINLQPQCAVYYGNRSAALMMVQKYGQALDDCTRSVQRDEKYTKVKVNVNTRPLYVDGRYVGAWSIPTSDTAISGIPKVIEIIYVYMFYMYMLPLITSSLALCFLS